MVAFAHLGHWYVQLLFAIPSIGIIGYMARDSLRRRAAARREGRETEAREGAPVPAPRGPVDG